MSNNQRYHYGSVAHVQRNAPLRRGVSGKLIRVVPQVILTNGRRIFVSKTIGDQDPTEVLLKEFDTALAADLQLVTTQAAIAASFAVVGNITPEIALDTGRLRTAFFEAMKQVKDSIQVVAGDLALVVPLNFNHIWNSVEYAWFHAIEAGYFTSYKDPTTPGTKPYSITEIKFVFVTVMEDEIIRGLELYGWELSGGLGLRAKLGFLGGHLG